MAVRVQGDVARVIALVIGLVTAVAVADGAAPLGRRPLVCGLVASNVAVTAAWPAVQDTTSGGGLPDLLP